MTWQRVDDACDDSSALFRMPVLGGWLYRHVLSVERYDGSCRSYWEPVVQSMAYVPEGRVVQGMTCPEHLVGWK